MASRSPDIWLWAGLAILGYYSAITIHTQLVNIRQASEVTHEDRPSDMLSQRTENALKLETLGQLALNANQDIEAASVKILSERSLQDGAAWRMILRDIGGSDIERRDKALTCLRFVMPYSRNNQEADDLVHSSRTYKAIIRCLCAMLPEASIAESIEPNDSAYRSQPEHDALWILQNILPFHSNEAREAGMISKWLAHYPFGGPSASPSDKKQIMLDIVDGIQAYEDSDFGYAMQSILDRVFKIDEFREEMHRYDLIDTTQPEQTAMGYIPEGAVRTHDGWQTRDGTHLDDRPDDDDWLANIPSGAIRTAEGGYRDTTGRRREESMEEQALRRRRRMAMVLGENGRPVQSGDIIQRDPVVLDEDVEEELEQLIEEVTEAEEAVDSGWWGLVRALRRLVRDRVAPLPVV